MTSPREILKFVVKLIGIERLSGLVFLYRYKSHFLFTLKMLRMSKSQIYQDVFVACQLRLWETSSESRYFVEFGATDGVDLSNTFLLEREFGWDGLLIEPALVWQKALVSNRKCNVDFRCVYKVSGEKIEFKESADAVYSTIRLFAKLDAHAIERENASEYLVETITLNDVLEEYQSPKKIDYLSIDTEGSELEILQSIDFSKWSFRVITVEHNYMPQREQIKELLNRNGYIRVFEKYSHMDDWYVKC